MISPDTLRALEIALVFSRQRQKKMAMRGLKRSMAQCWHRCCKRSKKAAEGKSFSSTKRGRRGRRKGRMVGVGYGRRRGRGPGANPVLRPASSAAGDGEILRVLGYTVNPRMVANFQKDVRTVSRAGFFNLPLIKVTNVYDTPTQKAYQAINLAMKKARRPLTDWVPIVKKARLGAGDKFRMSARPAREVRLSSARLLG